MWTVQEAKAKLSQVLQRARAGEPQVIGAQEPCVVISLDEYKRLTARAEEPHPGKWLVENLAGLGEIELPPRDDSRPIPFADWTEADWAELDKSS
jgi:prevent-host-death family protein